jgi:alkylhydroperoxidase/carboxymuconolactone decarboxylase family protein YurZ
MALTTNHRELMRRLALCDEGTLSKVMSGRIPGEALLDHHTRALVRLAGLVALGSETASFQVARDEAWAAGADDEEILETVIVVAPFVGTTRIASIIPQLDAAMAGDS